MATFPIPASTAIAYLAPRHAAIRAAIDALEPIMLPLGDRPSALLTGLDTVFQGLLDELDAVQLVMIAIVPESLADLAAQAEVIRYRYADHNDMRTVDGPLGQLLDHIGGLAA